MDNVQTIDRGPSRVARQARVNASADELFALLANPHRHHEADGSGMVEPSVIGPRELQLGDRFLVSMRMGPLPYRMTSTVTALEPGRLVEWQHPAGHRWRWEFDPQPDGSTLVTETFDYTGARSTRLMELIKAPQRNGDGIEKSLRRLQERYGS